MKSYKLYEQEDKNTFEYRLKEEIPKNSIILKKDKIISQYLSYCSLENDLNFVIDTASILIDYRVNEYTTINSDSYIDNNLIIKKSLFKSIITTYAKCFNASKKRSSLDEKFIEKNFPDDLLDLDKFFGFS
ncbi:MAG: hypothetical protein QM564_02840 [Bergeyella sp.]